MINVYLLFPHSSVMQQEESRDRSTLPEHGDDK